MVAKQIPWVIGIGALLAAYKLLGGSELLDEWTRKEIEETYDYIIVGGGTEGSLLATRLTDDPKKSVLLLEAGGDPLNNPDIDIPIFADTARYSEFDWQYQTVPQRHACKSHVDSSALWSAGKGLGGTSNINYMQYLRGSRHDYDEWANNGAQGWAYKDVLPYFIKCEDNRNAKFVNTIFHGFGGRMTVADVQLSPVSKISELAFREMGVKCRDTNGKNMFGYGHTQATIRSGTRWGTYRAFLRRAIKRDNLHITTYATVQKILFDGRKATGVVFKHNEQQKIVKSNKEIILSAGTVGTTKLMLLSGLGPRAHLNALKIPVIADLPVGENLQDHVQSGGIEFFTPHQVSITAAKSENFLSSWAYSLFGTGMKMSPRFREGTAYVKTRHQPPHLKYPLIGFHVVANVQVYSAEQMNMKDDSWDGLYGKPKTNEGFTIFPVLLHPKSRGTIRLRSSNPDDAPLINPNYLAEDFDIKILTEALQYSRKLVKTMSMQDWNFQISDSLLPECAKYGNFTNAYVECFIRHVTMSGNTPMGTCRMGAAGDPTAVVDPQLRVRGVKNLRVVDASIIPGSLSGNAYTTQVMIAEKAADLIIDVNTVKAIQDYFKHMVAMKHKKIMEDDDAASTDGAPPLKENEKDKKK